MIDDKANGIVEIAIPEIDYYEHLTFEGGDLQILSTGKRYQELRKRGMEDAKKNSRVGPCCR